MHFLSARDANGEPYIILRESPEYYNDGYVKVRVRPESTVAITKDVADSQRNQAAYQGIPPDLKSKLNVLHEEMDLNERYKDKKVDEDNCQLMKSEPTIAYNAVFDITSRDREQTAQRIVAAVDVIFALLVKAVAKENYNPSLDTAFRLELSSLVNNQPSTEWRLLLRLDPVAWFYYQHANEFEGDMGAAVENGRAHVDKIKREFQKQPVRHNDTIAPTQELPYSCPQKTYCKHQNNSECTNFHPPHQMRSTN